MVAGDLAEIGGTSAKAGNTGGSIAGAAAGSLDCRSHMGVQEFRSLHVHEIHGTFLDCVLDKKIVVASCNDVDDGIAYAEDVKLAHEYAPGFGNAGVCAPFTGIGG
jgi:hypothetical protein